MSRAKTIIGAMAVCALALAAFGASNALATPPGLTAVVCEEVGFGEGRYEDSHCQNEGIGGDYETVAVEEGTEVTAVSAEAPEFTAVIGLAKVLIECESSHGTGTVVNVVEEEEMHAHGTGGVGEFIGCHARLASHPAETCPISNGGTITTEPLTSITGPEHRVTVKPEGGTVFARFTILHEGERCTSLPEVEVTVTGEVSGEANEEIHSHLTFTEANNGNNLKANGGPAHIIGTGAGYMAGTEETVGLETFE